MIIIPSSSLKVIFATSTLVLCCTSSDRTLTGDIGGQCEGRPSGSVAQLAECSHGKREALGSSPGRATIFSSPVTFGGSVWERG